MTGVHNLLPYGRTRPWVTSCAAMNIYLKLITPQNRFLFLHKQKKINLSKSFAETQKFYFQNFDLQAEKRSSLSHELKKFSTLFTGAGN